MNPSLPLILAGLLLAPAAFAAEEATAATRPDAAQSPAPTAPVPNRFLLVLETSASMKNRVDAVQQFLKNFVGSSLLGQVSRGDTLGFWTFNEELWAGRFPLVEWHPSSVPTYAYRVEQFTAAQTYENKSRADRLMPHVTRLVEASKALTIVLITTGESPLEGTPFDTEINQAFAASTRQLRGDRLAFVVFLVAREGKLVDFAVNSTLGPYRMPNPPLPRIPIPAPAPTTPDPSTVPQRARPGTPPLVISTNLTPSPVPVADDPAASKLIAAGEVEQEPEPKSAVRTAGTNPPDNTPAPTQPAVARPTETAAVETPVVPTPAPRPQPRDTEPSSATARESTTSQPPIPAPQEQPPPTTPSTIPQPKPEPQPQPVRTVAKSTRTAPATSPVPAPVPTPESGRDSPPAEAAPATPAPESTSASPGVTETEASETSSPPMATTGQETRTWDPFLLAGVGFIIAGVAMAIYLWRQDNRPSRPSLISKAIKQRTHLHED
ncbi:MAG TPA: hypothetical protein VMS21_05125 [Methylomirabilota bacterium]|nr:hypothetical protein [Methylomirabilota bacterium]